MRKLIVAAVVLVILVALGFLGVLLLKSEDSLRAAPSSPAPTPRPTQTPAAAPADTQQGCPTVTAKPFTPTTISIKGVGSRTSVISLPRDANGVPGTAPLDNGGKTVFAFDRDQGIKPGAPRGNVLLNAHTWPDDTGLGNKLLSTLKPNSRIVVHGTGSQRLCYRVTREVEVLASEGLPSYYDTTGIPQLAIVVCSGQRLGPGDWTKRTVWFASPSV